MAGPRRAVLTAAVLSLAGIGGGLVLAFATGQPILAVFGVIVALAPWGALIDDVERAGRHRGGE